MSRYWPLAPYAEDQSYAHSILTAHVLTRAVTTGAIVALPIVPTLEFLRSPRVGLLKPKIPTSTFTTALLRSAGTGAVVATGLLCIALPARMWGREEIEWKDRSWRLLVNKGQVECDDWTYAGMAAGALGVAIKGKGLGWRGAVGGIALGSVAGTAGYMGWRYGMKGGKFEDDAS